MFLPDEVQEAFLCGGEPGPVGLGFSGRPLGPPAQLEPDDALVFFDGGIGRPFSLARQAERLGRVLPHVQCDAVPLVDIDDLILVGMVGQRFGVQAGAARGQDGQRRLGGDVLALFDLGDVPVAVQDQVEAACFEGRPDLVGVAQVFVVQIAAAQEVVVHGRHAEPLPVRIDLVAAGLCRADLLQTDPAVVVLVEFRFADARIETGDQGLFGPELLDLAQVRFVEPEDALEEVVVELAIVAELLDVGCFEVPFGGGGHQPGRLAQVPVHVVVAGHDHDPLAVDLQLRGQPVEERVCLGVFLRHAPFGHVARDHHRVRVDLVPFVQPVQVFIQFGE